MRTFVQIHPNAKDGNKNETSPFTLSLAFSFFPSLHRPTKVASFSPRETSSSEFWYPCLLLSLLSLPGLPPCDLRVLPFSLFLLLLFYCLLSPSSLLLLLFMLQLLLCLLAFSLFRFLFSPRLSFIPPPPVPLLLRPFFFPCPFCKRTYILVYLESSTFVKMTTHRRKEMRLHPVYLRKEGYEVAKERGRQERRVSSCLQDQTSKSSREAKEKKEQALCK